LKLNDFNLGEFMPKKLGLFSLVLTLSISSFASADACLNAFNTVKRAVIQATTSDFLFQSASLDRLSNRNEVQLKKRNEDRYSVWIAEVEAAQACKFQKLIEQGLSSEKAFLQAQANPSTACLTRIQSFADLVATAQHLSIAAHEAAKKGSESAGAKQTIANISWTEADHQLRLKALECSWEPSRESATRSR
jgi:hypothetical protein